MSTKVNANAQAIVSNIDKFNVDENYTYKQICQMCDMKEYSSGTGKAKQINTFKSLFNVDEGKVGRVTIYTITAIKDLTDEELASIVSNKRGKSEGSRGNNDIYCSKLNSNFAYNLRFIKDYYLSMSDRERERLFMENPEEDVDLLPHEYAHKLDTKPFRLLYDGDTVIFNLYRNQVIENMGIRNDNNVKVYTNTPNYFCEYNNINPNVARVVYPTVSKATHRAFESQIKKFKSEGLGVISKILEVKVISEYDSDGRKLILDDEEDLAIYEHNKIRRITMLKIADEDIRDQIDLIKLDVAKELDFKTPQDLYTRADKKTVTEFHKLVKEQALDKLGIFDYRPFIRITSSISMLEKYKSKFGATDGLIAFTCQMMKAIKSNVELFTDEEARQKRFKKKLDKCIEKRMSIDLCK